MESFYNFGRKRLFSEALSESKPTSEIKSKKKLSINSTVEVYYYAPCNYNQHETDDDESESDGWTDDKLAHLEAGDTVDEMPFEQMFSMYMDANKDQL